MAPLAPVYQGGFPHGFHHHFFRRMDPIQSSTIQLGSDNWESLVRRGAAPRAEFPAWLVHVYHDESAMCRELSSMWEETGKALRGVLRTGRVHAPAEQRLCRHMGVTSVPAYVLVMQNGSKFTQYGGGRHSKGVWAAEGPPQREEWRALGAGGWAWAAAGAG